MTTTKTIRPALARILTAATLGLCACEEPVDLDELEAMEADTEWSDLDETGTDDDGFEFEEGGELVPPFEPRIIGDDATTPNGARGVVHLALEANQGPDPERGCTGFVINRGVIVTAAHCFDKTILGNRDRGWLRMKIDYRPAGGPDKCLSAGSGGKCTSRYYHEVIKFPYWNGGFSHDIAVIRANQLCAGERCFVGLTDFDAFGIYNDSISKDRLHRVWGYGVFNSDKDSKLRTVRFNVNDQTTYTLQEPASKAKALCSGDSGGPWANFDHGGSGRYLAAGVHSGRDTSSGFCADNGKTMYATRMGPKVTWIEGVTGIDCRSKVSSDGGKKWFACW